MSHMRYELGFYIPQDDILHSHHRENHKSYRRKKVATLCIAWFFTEGTSAVVATGLTIPSQ
jgi:hypothetical protein